MPSAFKTVPTAVRFLITNARVPVPLLAAPLPAPASGLAPCDIVVSDGRITRIAAPGAIPHDAPLLDLDQGLVLPRLVDIHTHLDKGHISPRSPNPDGSFMGARLAVMADREVRWSAADVRARMEFALRSAFAHGTGAIRTHLDSIGPQTAISWPVFAELREAWRGRIALQAAALFPVVMAIDDEPQFRDIVATVARHGGVLGGFTFLNEPLDEKTDRALDHLFQSAAANGLDIDLHVDESDLPFARSLERIASAALRHRYKGRVSCGHCCSLALMDDAERARTIDLVGEAGLAVVSLPMCNMYLQDRTAGRTPRWRGVAPLHELDAAGVPVMVASDNTRDPFYAYGDLDMLEVFREATRILHFDHSDRPWTRLLGPAPAAVMGLDHTGVLAEGGMADLVLLSARTMSELNSRPQSDRIVLVGGRAIDRTLPDYRELDSLHSPARQS